MPRSIDVYLEIGAKRAFASAVDWPGWCRSGPDPDAALERLGTCGPRYGRAIRARAFGFDPPAGPSSFNVVERLKGDATTDFGAPGGIPALDRRPLDDAGFERQVRLLTACWGAFDRAARGAEGSELAKGPRGGGRELEAIVRHVLGADAGYLRHLGARYPSSEPRPEEARPLRRAVVDALSAWPRAGPLPAGPRGGVRWPTRYFVRRSAWHALDHAWEIEDRAVPE